MKPGSLVTPVRPDEENLAFAALAGLLSFLVEMPKHGTIYTVARVEPVPTHPHLTQITVEEIPVVFLVRRPGYAEPHRVGVPPTFYVEVAPPQENVQSVVNKIIETTQVLELV